MQYILKIIIVAIIVKELKYANVGATISQWIIAAVLIEFMFFLFSYIVDTFAELVDILISKKGISILLEKYKVTKNVKDIPITKEQLSMIMFVFFFGLARSSVVKYACFASLVIISFNYMIGMTSRIALVSAAGVLSLILALLIKLNFMYESMVKDI